MAIALFGVLLITIGGLLGLAAIGIWIALIAGEDEVDWN
jgi:hypothetical protein